MDMKKSIFFVAVALLCLGGTAGAQRHVEFRWHGMYLLADCSYGFNVNKKTDTVAGYLLSVAGGFQFRKEASIGVGFSYLSDPGGAFSQLPLYVEFRSHFLRSRFTPYTVLQLGYSVPVGGESEPPVTKVEKGGLYWGFDFGGRFAVSRSFAMGAHVGYRLFHSNEVTRSKPDNSPMLSDAVALHMVTAGVSFYISN